MKYWIGVASQEHVELGVRGGFCQLCHGKAHPLRRMKVGDKIVYYSPKEKFGDTKPFQKFTALGVITGHEVYQIEMFPGFTPYRRDVEFKPCRPTLVRDLIPLLSTFHDKTNWGMKFRFGHFEISKDDFEIIEKAMLFG